jgi:peptidoglycan/LPS O-acetylase OafA/YrhL
VDSHANSNNPWLEPYCIPIVHSAGFWIFRDYLWQQLFLAGAEAYAMPLGVWQRCPVSLVASFACATASYYFLEKPLLRVGHQLSARSYAKEPHSLVM